MIATLRSATERQKESCGKPLNTFGVTLDQVVEIVPAGYEDVFDIQVADTENFIANGLVSHNTRWHEDDLVGRLTDPQNDNFDEEESAKWKILSLPALAGKNDPIGRKEGESLWPEKFPVEFLEGSRRLNKRSFSALYQCSPTPEEGVFFLKDSLLTYKRGELPTNLRMYCGSDHAVSTKQGSDSTVLLPVGLDERGTIWVMPASL